MSTASISIGMPRVNLKLDDLRSDFKAAGADQHLRFSEAKGLHTHSRFGASMVDFLAKFRNPAALEQRAELRQAAVAHVKTAIDNQYGKGMGDRVFAATTGETGWDAAKGVTKSNLQFMNTVARDMRDADIAKAETILGGGGVTDAIITARNGGCAVEHLDPDEMAALRHAVADAVNGLPQPVTKAGAERAAQGAVLKHEMLGLARAATDANPSMNKVGLNNHETSNFNAVMDSFFKPGGANVAADFSTLRDVLSSFMARASSPSLAEVTSSLTRLGAQRAPLAARAADIRDFVGTLANPTKEVSGTGGQKQVLTGLEEGDLAAFMRANPSKPADPGFTAFAIIRGAAENSVKPSLDTAVNVVKGLGKFEYREMKLEGLPADQQRKVAQDSVRAFDSVMTAVLGGKDGHAIDGAVNKLSQEFCDLLATAHDTLGEEAGFRLSQDTIDKAPGATPDERRANAERDALGALHKKLDVNFFALRVLNPMLVDAGVASPKDNAKLVAVSKLVQDAANGVDTADKGKEVVHASVADALQQTVGEWGDAYAEFMDKARARGNVIV